jgi:hypothetical protein
MPINDEDLRDVHFEIEINARFSRTVTFSEQNHVIACDRMTSDERSLSIILPPPHELSVYSERN